MDTFFGHEMPKLGFGMMRLPRLEDGKIDVEQTKIMVDKFLDAGLIYVDTAFVYEGSEDAVREALVKRHPRDKYFLATKLNARAAENEEAAKQEFYTSLERTQAQYFDFYLLHALSAGNIEKYDEYHLWDFVKELKEKGLIKHYGFSFHDKPEVLDKLLTEHPDVEFVQLQLNYADWENPSVTSRANYEVARKHGKPIVVMEPIKGGTLANPPEAVKKVFHDAEPNMSVASWAVRYVASLEGVMTVLSGMSNIAQMEDNLSYMEDFKPLNEAEQDVIQSAQEILASIDQVPCTGCRYCTPGCPMQIDIPQIFTALNREKIYGQLEAAKHQYESVVSRGGGKASDCVHCLQCEGACPQHIHITQFLEEAVTKLEG